MILLEVTLQDMGLALLGMFFIITAWSLAEFRSMKEEIRNRLDIKNESLRLRLQAYERLTVFVDRIAIKNLVSRTSYEGLSVVDLQLALLGTIRTEFEYNVSQQIYVSVDLWKGITNLKDQNIYVINQVAAVLPSGAAGVELSKRLLEVISGNNTDLSPLILDAIQHEAKKLQ
jgi:hypothetical protein